MTTQPTNATPFTFDDWQAMLDAQKQNVPFELIEELWYDRIEVLPPILWGGTVTMPDGRIQPIQFGMAEGADFVTVYWTEGKGDATRYFGQGTTIMNQYDRTNRHPKPDEPKDEMLADGGKRTWLDSGREYSNGQRDAIREVIEAAVWLDPDEPVGYMPGMGIRGWVQYCNLPKPSAIAVTGFGSIALYGMICRNGDNGWCRMFIVEEGIGCSGLVADFYEGIPMPSPRIQDNGPGFTKAELAEFVNFTAPPEEEGGAFLVEEVTTVTRTAVPISHDDRPTPRRDVDDGIEDNRWYPIYNQDEDEELIRREEAEMGERIRDHIAEHGDF